MPSKCSEVKKSYNLVQPPEFTRIEVWISPYNNNYNEITGMSLFGSKGYVGFIKDLPGGYPGLFSITGRTVSEFGLHISSQGRVKGYALKFSNGEITHFPYGANTPFVKI